MIKHRFQRGAAIRWLARFMSLPGWWVAIAVSASGTTQLVSFRTSYSEVRRSERQAVVCLVRYGRYEELQLSSMVPICVRYLNQPHSQGTTAAHFPAGCALGFCTVRLPEAQFEENQYIAALEIVENGRELTFARKFHFVKVLGQPETTAGPLINAVIFSGADSPEDAVDAGKTQALVNGGIVALGGGGVPSVYRPATLTPGQEYLSGLWTPPLSPPALVIQFGSWRTTLIP